MPKEWLRRSRYLGGQVLRFISRPWREFEISPEQAVTIFGCSFGDHGWHHVKQTLFEYENNPKLLPENSSMGKFHQNFLPSSISQVAGVKNAIPLPLFVYPWGTFVSGDVETDKLAESSRFCGPSSEAFIRDEFSATIRLYKEIDKLGYNPDIYPNSLMFGTWLIAKDGRKRFVVMQGNHRMAILSFLGFKKIRVRISGRALNKVCEKDIEKWPMVKSGAITKSHAQKVFDHFFIPEGFKVF